MPTTTNKMATLAQARELILVAFAEELISEEEFLLLYDLNSSKNPIFPYWNYQRFVLGDINDAECKAEFRFEKPDINLLAGVLQIPDRFICPQGTVVSGVEGLCILLKRLAYPCRLSDMIPRFGRPVAELSMITTTVLDYLYNTHAHHLRRFDQPILSRRSLQLYCQAIHEKGAALDNCWGFVDGTVRPICRPGEHQRLVYNGHKRIHSLKFQSVVTPNGLIANLFGPVGKYYSRHTKSVLMIIMITNSLFPAF